MIHRFGFGNDGNKLAAGQKLISPMSDIELEHSLLQVHDPDSPDMTYAANVARELLYKAAANVVVYARTNNSDHDEVWEEDPDPTYGSGKRMKAFFVPQPLEVQLTPWGVDAENKSTVVFILEDIYKEFGQRMVRAGDLIELPYNSVAIKPDRYMILNAFESGNFRYHWLYLSCNVENILDDKVLDIDHK